MVFLLLAPFSSAQMVLDTTIAECGRMQLNADSAERYIWTPTDGLSRTDIPNPVASPSSSTIYSVTGYVLGLNMVTNGNFEAGNVGFQSDYGYSSDLIPEKKYYVGPNARETHAGFANMGDHTSGSGNYMIVNGAGDANAVIWSQTLTLVPHSVFSLSFWLVNLNSVRTARLQLSVNGMNIGEIHSVGGVAQWGQMTTTWMNDTVTTAVVAIVNQNTAMSGNDFAIDDIEVVPWYPRSTQMFKIDIERDTVWRSACEYYIWNETNEVYTHSDTIVKSYRVGECDSLVVLGLSIGERHVDTTVAEVCTRYYWSVSHSIYTQSGLYEYHVAHDSMCDTDMVLNLIILDCPTNVNPDNVDWPSCTSRPPGDAFGMREIYSCNGVNAMSTPMVGDVDGDGVPEVLACAFSGDPGWGNRILVIDGRNGTLKYTISTATYRTAGQLMSIADVDRDGTAEFFLLADDGYLYCYSAIGTGQVWRSNVRVNARYLVMTADVNGDGRAEVVCGPYIFDALTGTLLLQGADVSGGWGYGAPHTSGGYGRIYYMQALADLDHDGTLEFCAGNTVYKPTITNISGTTGNTWEVLRQANNIAEIRCYDGQSFLADFDNDGDVDVCVIGFCGGNHVNVYVWEGQTSRILAYYDCWMGGQYDGSQSPSIPFAGDLDGNGTPEIIFNYPDAMRAFTYDPSLPNHMRMMHKNNNWGETAGFTVFDFNQDGKEEIVYRNIRQMYIADGTTLAYLCSPLTTYSGTIAEYTIVADANGDGHANIIVCHAHCDWFSGCNADGKVSVFGSAQLDAWGSARKVWNQWCYSSVHINDDLTVPQYQLDLATIYPNGKKPFNGFLRQMPHLDQNGDIYVEVSNLEPDTAAIAYADEEITVNVNYDNRGDSRINAPYSITLYCDDYRGDVIGTYQVDNTLPLSGSDSLDMRVPRSIYCQLKCDSIAVALNDAGHGIGQNGGQQPECDTTNNVYKIPLSPFVPRGDTSRLHACDTFTWIRSHHGDTLRNFFQKSVFIWDSLIDHDGCDSIRALDLNVTYRFHDSVYVEVCDTFTWDVNGKGYNASIVDVDSMLTIDQCDSVWKLYLTVNYSYTFYPKDSVADTLLPYYFIDREYHNDVRRDHFHYTTIHGCDSDYYFTLYVDYHRISCDGFLQFPNVVTPNGDGINDRFVIRNLLWEDCYPKNELFIFNRWGERVFYKENISEDGDFWNPEGLPAGTYYFRFVGRGAAKQLDRRGVIEVVY